jgi:hypothetical protein
MKRVFNKQALIGTGERKNNSNVTKRLPPYTPEHPPISKFAASVIHKQSKVENSSLRSVDKINKRKDQEGRIEFKGKYLSDEVTAYSGNPVLIKNDVDALWSQFEIELKDEMSKRHPIDTARYYNPEVKMWKRFCYNFTRYYQNTAKACDSCHISRNHFYRARELYPTLDLILNIIEDRFVDEVEETTKKHSLLPNSIVERIFLLKTRRKDKYMDQPQLLSATKIEVNIPNIKGMRGDDVGNIVTVGQVKGEVKDVEK